VSWAGKRVLVTGAGGFIGSHLVERLITAGATVRAMVHYNALGSRGWLDRSAAVRDAEVVAGDITDPDSVLSAMRGTDVAFHLAALIAIPYSYQAPRSFIRANIDGTVNVLQAARELGISRVVHTSTSEVYGTAREVPISESHPLQGQSPYSASKIGADKQAEAFFLSFGVPVVTVRPFNTYGPRQSARAVIPTIITQGLQGSRIKLGSLAPTRDLVFVEDTAAGFMAAGLAPNVEGRTINLGTGREISIGDLVKVIGQIIGSPLHVDLDDARLRPPGSEVERLLADASLAKSLLGWTSNVTLEQGLARTVAWFRSHRDGYHADVYAV
jgi:NAD dependent epimerase/dehydratase